MIFLKCSLITFTTLIVAMWVMPVTSLDSDESESELSHSDTDDEIFFDIDPNIFTLQSMK